MTSETAAPIPTMLLDGQAVPVLPGDTIYDVAQRQGQFLPTLCYDPRLKPFGACRLCIVEIKGVRNPVPACTSHAAPGLEVTTNSPHLDAIRKTLLEMVASENREIDVSPLSGLASQELAVLIDHYQARTGRFVGVHSGHSRLDDENPFLLRDYDQCISCYRCVRVCSEQEGDHAISVMGRGFHTQIVTEFDGWLRDSACTSCGQCVQTCPTGALGDKKALRFAEAEVKPVVVGIGADE